MARQSLRIQASDGRELAATFFPGAGDEPRVPVLIGGGMGIIRRFYARFAGYLASRGHPVMTFDWRGIGASAGNRATDRTIRLAHWGERDLPAAIAALQEATGETRIAYVGHSIGGVVPGFCPEAGAAFERILLIAAQSGYWKLWNGPRKLLIAGAWWLAIPAVSRLYGRVPGRLMGGVDLPATVTRDWARLARQPGYVLAHGPEVRENFRRIRCPLRAYAIADDPMAPERAVTAAVSMYANAAPREQIACAPEDIGLPRVGHFGFFRDEAQEAWVEAANWLAVK